jgi:hypothetical protein
MPLKIKLPINVNEISIKELLLEIGINVCFLVLGLSKEPHLCT